MKDGNNCVLFVDDEKNILNALRRGLFKEKYLKFFAVSGEEALKIMKSEEIDVIVTDMKMPVMSGLELLKIVTEEYPNVIKIVLSGYTQLPQILATINQVDIFKFITKPWDMETEFKKVINDAIYYFNIHRENKILRESLEKKNAIYQKLLRENDEKIRVFRKDYGNAINLFGLYGRLFFSKVGKEDIEINEIKDNIEAYREGLDIIEQYFSNLPTVYEEFTLSDIEHKIENYILSLDNIEENEKFFQYKNKVKSKRRYRGDLCLIVNIMKLFIKYYIADGKKEHIRIIVDIFEKKDEDEVNYIISIKNKYFAEYSLLVENLNVIFFEMAKIVGAEIKYSEVKDTNIISVKFNF